MSERLTKRFNGGYGLVNVKEDEQDVESKFPNTLQAILDSFDWLGRIEDALFDADGNEVISLDRLRELAEAEREGRAVVLPVKLGTWVKQNFGNYVNKVEAVTIYENGRVSLCFHNIEKREQIIDEWEEVYAQDYHSDEENEGESK